MAGDGILGRIFTPNRDEYIAESSRILYKAVVVDVINDLDMKDNYLWSNLVTNAGVVENCPRNSCIIKVVSDGEGKTGQPMLAYPFFPPYLCFPIKPGEQCWIIMERTDEPQSLLPYWMCRVPSNDLVDDINYTHADRQYTVQKMKLPADRYQEILDNPDDIIKGVQAPGFPNGQGSKSNATLPTAPAGGPNAYGVIRDSSVSMSAFKKQTVPRFSKRIGDLVFQGSNNTLICLGTNRGWTVYNDIVREGQTSNATLPVGQVSERLAGAIDMVVGRGRWPLKPTKWYPQALLEKGDSKNQLGQAPFTTSPRQITNQGGWVETDKNPQLNGFDYLGGGSGTELKKGNNNPDGSVGLKIEGDPDFVNDASRVYIAQASNCDIDFGLSNVTLESSSEIKITDTEETIPTSYVITSQLEADPPKIIRSMLPTFPIMHRGKSAYIVQKSDNIRLVARKKLAESLVDPAGYESRDGIPYIDHNGIIGTIRLIKEGTIIDKNTGSTDSSAICMEIDGSIHLNGRKIYIGRSELDGGHVDDPAGGRKAGTNKGPGDEELDVAPADRLGGDRGVSQPWVKYQQLEDLWNGLMDELSSFCDTLMTHTTPGYGSPAPQINTAANTLKTKIGLPEPSDGLKASIVRLKSTRIFGE